MSYARLIHVVPFIAVGLLEACGGGNAVHARRPAIAAGEPHPQPAPVIRDFDVLAAGDSGVNAAQNVVIRNAAELSALWAVYSSNRIPAPPVPEVDFSRKMVVGVFLGQQPNGCASVGMNHVRDEGARLTVSYAPPTAQTTICPAVIRTPSVLAVIDRSDAPVDFVPEAATVLPLVSLESSLQSNVKVARNVVVKDAAAWSALWAEHAGTGAPPAVDFSQKMVVASFIGQRPTGCYNVTLTGAWRAGPAVTVYRRTQVPGPAVLCTQAFTSPAHMVVMDRTDDQVVFLTETVVL